MTDPGTDVALQVRDLFDAKAANWPAKYARGGRLAGRLVQFADAVAFRVPPGGTVLDLGCGTGELTLTIAGGGMRATGCDISSEMLRVAAKAGASCDVDWVELKPDWDVLPFLGETFDAVVASSVLEYVNDPAAVLRECCRILRPGGVVVCTVPDPRHPVRWLEWPMRMLAGSAVARAAGRWARLGAYLTYLEISQQRHLPSWWQAVAAQAGLLGRQDLPEPADRSPLRLFIFQRGSETAN